MHAYEAVTGTELPYPIVEARGEAAASPGADRSRWWDRLEGPPVEPGDEAHWRQRLPNLWALFGPPDDDG